MVIRQVVYSFLNVRLFYNLLNLREPKYIHILKNISSIL